MPRKGSTVNKITIAEEQLAAADCLQHWSKEKAAAENIPGKKLHLYKETIRGTDEFKNQQRNNSRVIQ